MMRDGWGLSGSHMTLIHEQIASVICLGLCHLCQPITGRRSSSRVPLASQLMASVLYVCVSLINTPL